MELVKCLTLYVLFTLSSTHPSNVTINFVKKYLDIMPDSLGIVYSSTSKKYLVLAVKAITSSNNRYIFISTFDIKHENIYKVLKSSHRHKKVIVDGDYEEIETFIIECGRNNFFSVKYHWLIISQSNSIFEKFNKVHMNIDSQLMVAWKNNNESWIIEDTYNPASNHGGILRHHAIGFYNITKGFNIRIPQPKYWKRRNMTGVTFKTMVVLLVPFEGSLMEYLQSEDNKTINTFNRFQHKLLRFCRDYYNFTMITEMGKSWGYPLPNGSFDGMVGALDKKVIDFGSSPIFVREDRAKFIDYGRNTWSWKAGFLFRSPKSLTSIESFLKPFSTSIWLILALVVLFSIFILKVVTTIENRNYRKNVETTWSVSVLFTLGALCQQGSPSLPKMTCGRITAVSIFVLSFIIYQFYSASLISNLLMKPTNRIKNLKDLLESPLGVGCEDVIYNKDLFSHTTDKILKELYYKKIRGKNNKTNFFSPEEGLNYVKDGGYAFHVEVARAYPIIRSTFTDQAICELQEVKLFKNTDLYNTYQKESPFYDMLETCFQKIAEHGILYREIKNWHPRKPECIQDKILLNFHVGLVEFYPALLILMMGIISSLIILGSEIYADFYRSRKLLIKFHN